MPKAASERNIRVMNKQPGTLLASPSRKRRWWLYLLVVFGVLMVLALVAVLLVFTYAKSLVRDYTTTTPRTFPKVQFDAARQKAMETRFAQFSKAVQARQNPAPFTISADDINQVLAKNKELRDYVHIAITNDQLVAEFSAPLEQTGRPELKGRFVNGSARINVVFQDGWLTVNVGAVEANGKPIPGWILKRLPQENLLKNLDQNPEMVNLFQELESIQITDGNVVLTPRAPNK